MRAACHDRFGDLTVLQVREHPTPRPGPREVLVRVRAAALNPKDVRVRSGRLRLLSGSRFPRVVGCDLAGEVVAKGERVRGVALGQQVFGMIDGWRAGACAQYALIHEDQCGPMPTRLSFEEAAGVPLAALTALQALRDLVALREGSRLCINGASGGVGVYAIQIARALGAHVTAVSSAESAALCRSLGAHEHLDYAREDPFAQERAFDAVFDVFGNGRFSLARRALTPKGVYVSTVPSARLVLDLARSWLGWPRARLVVVRSRASDLGLLKMMIDRGLLSPIIDSVHPLDDIAAAYRRLETKHARGKVVIRLDQPQRR